MWLTSDIHLLVLVLKWDKAANYIEGYSNNPELTPVLKSPRATYLSVQAVLNYVIENKQV
jgi:hypothetical protein